MNITQEDQGNLTTLLKVVIEPEDYKPSVDKQLKDYQKKAQEPGFRVGKVPIGIIDKKYGKAIRLDEVNKILSDKINNYIQENELPILGQPLANQENMPTGDFSKNDTFEFYFDIGLSPDIDLKLDERTFDFYRIAVDDKQIDEIVENIRSQHGSQEPVDDEIKEGDVVKGAITELDESAEAKTEGVFVEKGSINVDYIKDEDTKKEFLGKKSGDVVHFDPKKYADDNASEIKSLLEIEDEQIENISNNFSFEIEEVVRNKPAEVNEELFKKAYPEDEINTEEEFRNKIKEDAEKAYERESERLLMAQVSEKLVDEIDPQLPDEFLKRWLVQNDEKLTAEAVEKDYEKYSRSMKWQLIENQIIKKFDVQVTDDEVKEQIRSYFMQQMGGGEISEDMQKQLEPIVESMMQNKEQTKQIYDQLFDEKISKALKESAILDEKKVSYDEFIKIAQAQQPKQQEEADDENNEEQNEPRTE